MKVKINFKTTEDGCGLRTIEVNDSPAFVIGDEIMVNNNLLMITGRRWQVERVNNQAHCSVTQHYAYLELFCEPPPERDEDSSSNPVD